MKTTLKDWPRIFRKLENADELTHDERFRFARCLAATPDERWEMNVNGIRALGLAGPVRSRRELEQRKTKLRRLDAPILWRLQLSNAELSRGRMFGAELKLLNQCQS